VVAAPPHHPSIARALGPVAATMRAALDGLGAAPRRVVVGVSGGADSMATLGLLELLRRRLTIELVVAHVDHGLRAGARAESELVLATARARGHATWHRRVVLERGAGLPARARALRRDALLDAASACGASIVVLGHTMTDRAETLLLNLARGAGLEGLGAMPASQPWWKPASAPCRCSMQGLWVRPIMHIERAGARELVERLGLPFVDDPSNDDDTHPRVRVRRHLLPELVALNPGAIAHIAATADLAQEAAAALRTDPIGDTHAYDVATLRALPIARRRAAILALCRAADVPRDALAARTLDGIVAAIAHDRPHRWDLRGAVLRLEGGRLWIDETAPTAASDEVGAGAARAQPLTHPTGAAILRKLGRHA